MRHILAGTDAMMQGQRIAMASTEQPTDGQSQHALPSGQKNDVQDDVSKPQPVAGRGMKRSHSVWSLSSSSASDVPSLQTSAFDRQSPSEALLLPEEHDNLDACVEPTAPSTAGLPQQPLEGLTHFPLGIKLKRPLRDFDTAVSVTAKMLGPTFDPEEFVMDCLTKQRADQCMLMDYIIKPILFSETGQHAKKPSFATRSTPDCWAIVLIAAVLCPWSSRGPYVLTDPDIWAKTVKTVTFAVKIYSKSGEACLHVPTQTTIGIAMS